MHINFKLKVLNTMNKFTLPGLYKNIAMLFTGAAIGQIITLIAYPVLSRIYEPAHFGILASVLAISSIIVPIATLRYESAIVIEKNNDYAYKVQMLCMIFLLAISFSTLMAMVIFPNIFYFLKFSESHKSFIYFSVPIIFLLSYINVLSARLNREGMYTLMAKITILRKVGIVSFQLIFALLGFTALGLIFGQIIGVSVAVLAVLYFTSNSFSDINKGQISLRDIALRYIDFPKYSVPQSLIHSVMSQLPIIVFGVTYGSSVVGYYFLASKIVQLPIMFLGQSVRTVFLKHASDHLADIPQVYNSFKKTTYMLLGIIILPIVVLFVSGEDLFAFFFGEKWRQAGIFSSWLMIWYGGNFIQQPARSLFIVFELQKNLLYLDFFLGITRIIGLSICIIYYDVIAAVAVYSIISFTFFVITILGWYKFLKNRL
jgi:lipopolysaccharide exporter